MDTYQEDLAHHEIGIDERGRDAMRRVPISRQANEVAAEERNGMMALVW